MPLWHDVIAAGIAVACYSVFFSMPFDMMPWPIAVGAAAHALRWVVLTAVGASAATGAFVACLIVGVIIAPISRRLRTPFAAIAFASVVSIMPGVFMFRMASGLVQLANSSQMTWELMEATFADGSIAILVILAMSLGLIIPKLILDYVGQTDEVDDRGVRSLEPVSSRSQALTSLNRSRMPSTSTGDRPLPRSAQRAGRTRDRQAR